MQNCPCGSNQSYSNCCDAYISGKQSASTPEALMRSRYTAYTQANIGYIARTMKAPANKDFEPEESRAWAKQVDWKKLEVLQAYTTLDQGFVEFLAFYFHNGQHCVLHELSEFHFLDGQWFYVDGKPAETKAKPQSSTKVSRNDVCPCGSNNKYKKCCGKIA